MVVLQVNCHNFLKAQLPELFRLKSFKPTRPACFLKYFSYMLYKKRRDEMNCGDKMKFI